MVDTTTYPGGITINNGEIVSVYSADDVGAALGLPSGYLTNGLYVVLSANNSYWIDRLVAKPKTKKIGREYLYIPEFDDDQIARVALTGNYNDLYNRPIIYTDIVRYNNPQSLSSTQKSTARNNIDVYSKSEVDNKIGSGVNLSGYAKTSEVQTMISNAIGNAIGGSY